MFLYYEMRIVTRHLKFYIKALGIAGRNFMLDDCATVSSSISFVFLLAVIPFSALFLVVLNLFQDIFSAGIYPDDMIAILVEDINRFIPFVSKQWVQTHLIESVGLGSFTTINLLMLPIISGLLFKSLEEAFRRIFDLPPRSLLMGQAVYAIMSIFAILAFFMANFIWTITSEATQSLQQSIHNTPYINDIYVVVLDYFSLPQINLVSWSILTLFFLTTVKVFVRVEFELRHRVAAGLLFGLFWLMAREIFGLYIQHVARINVLFGSLGSVCIVLLWIFYSSVALLYSVEFMYVLHCGPFKLWKKDSRRLAIK